jgi:hypothetical protein
MIPAGAAAVENSSSAMVEVKPQSIEEVRSKIATLRGRLEGLMVRL